MHHELKFYRSAFEDVKLANTLQKTQKCQPRHVIILFHDALEFLMYEALQLSEIDIYQNGQNTIGFDKALTEVNKLGYNLCYMATIRELQKLRGDAKHHAQDVEWNKIEEISKRWEIACSCLIWDMISQAVNPNEFDWPFQKFSKSQYTLYQRERNKNWESAARHLLTAIIHKKCDVDLISARPKGLFIVPTQKLVLSMIDHFNKGVSSESVLLKKDEIIQFFKSSLWEEACDILSKIYSSIDYSDPIIFNKTNAVFITDNLALADGYRGNAGMSWSKWSKSDTEEYKTALNDIKNILTANPKLIQKFGSPEYEDDGDRYWKWWDFVIFDGDEWHSFILEEDFRISPESYHERQNRDKTREKVAQLIKKEISNAIYYLKGES